MHTIKTRKRYKSELKKNINKPHEVCMGEVEKCLVATQLGRGPMAVYIFQHKVLRSMELESAPLFIFYYIPYFSLPSSLECHV